MFKKKKLRPNYKAVFIIMLFAVFFTFPQKINGTGEIGQVRCVWYADTAEADDTEIYLPYKILFVGEYSDVCIAEILFTNLFENVSGKISLMPEDVKLLGVEISDGTLNLNVSSEILGYGGTAYENALAGQIMRTASEIDGVTKLSLLIDGEIRPLCEGSVLENEKVPITI